MPHRSITDLSRARARTLRSTMTDAERALWKQLRAHRMLGVGFRRQVPIGPYIVDFASHDAWLIIEVDGGQHAASARSTADERRTGWLNAHGYRVLRFWNHDVLGNLDGVLASIELALAEARPPRRAGARQ